jgi:hypothetical protein
MGYASQNTDAMQPQQQQQDEGQTRQTRGESPQRRRRPPAETSTKKPTSPVVLSQQLALSTLSSHLRFFDDKRRFSCCVGFMATLEC